MSGALGGDQEEVADPNVGQDGNGRSGRRSSFERAPSICDVIGGEPCMQALWGSHISSWTVLTFLGQRLMIMMMDTRTQPHLHQPWGLDRCNHSFINTSCLPNVPHVPSSR